MYLSFFEMLIIYNLLILTRKERKLLEKQPRKTNKNQTTFGLSFLGRTDIRSLFAVVFCPAVSLNKSGKLL